MQKNFNARLLGVKIVRGMSSVVDHIVMVIFLLLLIIGAYSIWDSNQVIQDASAARFQTYKPTAEDSVSFEELKQINSDVFAWLTVYGTNIDYPVVQTADNYTYLNMNALGEFSLTGSIYLDCGNTINFEDFNSIIYGHHMEEGVMFGDIDKFIEKAYFDAHPYGNLYFNGAEHGVEFFAFLEADAYDWRIYDPGVKGEAAQKTYLSGLLEKAKYVKDIGVTADDKIVLLSTCASYATNGRHILAGRIVSDTFKNTFETEPSENVISEITQAQSITEFIGSIPMWAWIWMIVVLIVILIILYVLVTARKRKNRKKQEEDVGEPTKIE